jgi:hypothetical protein
MAPALPVLNPIPAPDPRIPGLASHGVKWMVAELMAADSSLTNANLLSHFTKIKLAGMLCRAWDSQQAYARACA